MPAPTHKNMCGKPESPSHLHMFKMGHLMTSQHGPYFSQNLNPSFFGQVLPKQKILELSIDYFCCYCEQTHTYPKT